MGQEGMLGHDPQHVCPACGEDGALVAYHREPLLASFGTAPPFPCESDPLLPSHVCCRCRACGCQWAELPATGDTRGAPDDGTLEGDEQGGAMTIRKTGAVTGSITGIEGSVPGDDGYPVFAPSGPGEELALPEPEEPGTEASASDG